MQTAIDRPAYLVESVDRALRVLQLLRERQDLTLTTVSRSLGVAPSTAHRLLSTLAYRDFVRQDPDTKVYTAGQALLTIGLAAVGSLDVRRLARPELEALAAELGETVHLACLDGDKVLFLDTVESPRPVRVTDRTGVTLPAYSAASGKVLLAELAPDVLQGLLPKVLPAVTHRTCTSRDELDRELAEIRRTGFAVNLGESERGLSAVAVAVPSSSGPSALALTASVPSEHISAGEIERMAAATGAAATRVGTRLTHG
ncbi:MAG TPA: IclR family transcriptional regulator [Euzebyales bacterium]|nr:IclR family transcriptional regulator [Euzebyales bacterium]